MAGMSPSLRWRLTHISHNFLQIRIDKKNELDKVVVMLSSPKRIDAFILSVFAILITWQPFFNYVGINPFELGIYLPGIESVLNGQVPFRDVFHLRGPLELLVPAWMMKWMGEHVLVLNLYFYAGTVLGFILCVWIAKEILRTRMFFYLLIPVLVGRAFPRAVFHNWGGMRFSLGLLALLFTIIFFKTHKKRWLVLSAAAAGAALLTSFEIGVCAIVSTMASLGLWFILDPSQRRKIFSLMGSYALGLSAVLVPFIIYLAVTASAQGYWDATISVLTNMTKVFPDHLFEAHPSTLVEAIAAMNPFSPHFKHLTPAYCYLAMVFLLIIKLRKNSNVNQFFPLVVLTIYGFFMYAMAFRKIGGAVFEMALQQEKILLFFLLEEGALFFLNLKDQYRRGLMSSGNEALARTFKKKILAIHAALGLLILSSVGYSIQRYNHRFPAFKVAVSFFSGKDIARLAPFKEENPKRLEIPRARGMMVPAKQAQEIESLVKFIDQNTAVDEPVFMFPEYAIYSFLANRPFVGRFPMVSFAWIKQEWHEEILSDLKRSRPRFAILPAVLGATFEKIYFKIPQTRINFDQFMDFIDENYSLILRSQYFLVYRRSDISGPIKAPGFWSPKEDRAY